MDGVPVVGGKVLCGSERFKGGNDGGERRGAGSFDVNPEVEGLCGCGIEEAASSKW